MFYTLIVPSIDRERSLAAENYIRLFRGYGAVRYLYTMRMYSPLLMLRRSCSSNLYPNG